MEKENAQRTIAVTVWGHRISPVFDSARTLLIVHVDGTRIVSSSHLQFDPDRLAELVQVLQAHKVVVIICGAVSEEPATVLEAAGFELIPFVAGDFHRVLTSYLQGGPLQSEFTMPGCGKHICCQGKIRRGQEIKPSPGRRHQGRGQRMPWIADERQNEKRHSAIVVDTSVKLIDES